MTAAFVMEFKNEQALIRRPTSRKNGMPWYTFPSVNSAARDRHRELTEPQQSRASKSAAECSGRTRCA